VPCLLRIYALLPCLFQARTCPSSCSALHAHAFLLFSFCGTEWHGAAVACWCGCLHGQRLRTRGGSKGADRRHQAGGGGGDARGSSSLSPAANVPRTLQYKKLPPGGDAGDYTSTEAESFLDRGTSTSIEATRAKVEHLLQSASLRLGLEGDGGASSQRDKAPASSGRDQVLAERVRARAEARQRSRSRERERSRSRSRSSARDDFTGGDQDGSGGLRAFEEIASASVKSRRVSPPVILDVSCERLLRASLQEQQRIVLPLHACSSSQSWAATRGQRRSSSASRTPRNDDAGADSAVQGGQTHKGNGVGRAPVLMAMGAFVSETDLKKSLELQLQKGKLALASTGAHHGSANEPSSTSPGEPACVALLLVSCAAPSSPSPACMSVTWRACVALA
jgi:hypothetical protein